MTTPIRVLLADDHVLVRSGLRLLLEKELDIVVIGEAQDGADAVQQAIALCPDVILMDITLPVIDGIESTRQICATCPDARVVALTMHAEDAYLTAFLEAGGLGYVPKSAADRDLVSAVRTVVRGEIFLRSEGVQVIAGGYRKHKNTAQELEPEALSERERTVLELTARGFTSAEIGEQLCISPRTVETYRTRVMEKLELQHRSQLVEYALRHHLLK